MDVVIPVAPKDYPIVGLTLFSLRRCVTGVRDIHLFCPEADLDYLEDYLAPQRAIVHSEDSLPYREGIAQRLHHFKPRRGWYLQQLIKLCGPMELPELSEQVLVVDGDVVFYKATDFLPQGVPQYLSRKFKIVPYFEYIERVFGYPRQAEASGVCHLMLLQKPVLRHMESYLQERQGEELPLWQLLLSGLKDEHLGMSEYEIYFNFLHRFAQDHPFELTETITYADRPRSAFSLDAVENYVAYHSYLK